jgi:hypothetical protein
MNEKIEEIVKDLENDKVNKLQTFLSFREKERLAISELEKLTGLSKSLAIAVACKAMVEEIKKSETQQDGKE